MMLKLTTEEQAWLDAYRKALDKKHPGAVREILIYGSKARGQAHAESDLDVLVVLKDNVGALKKRTATNRLPCSCEHGSFSFHSGLHRRRVGKPKEKRIHVP
jgi:predicted nucleotidyltransferase